MPTCKVNFGISSGNSVIEVTGKVYIWSPEREVIDAGDRHLAMWLQGEKLIAFEMEDEHPFPKIIDHINLEVKHVRFLTYFGAPIDPEKPEEMRISFAQMLEEMIAEDEKLLERVTNEVLRLAPPEGLDIRLAPKEGKLGELYAAVFKKYGTKTLKDDAVAPFRLNERQIQAIHRTFDGGDFG